MQQSLESSGCFLETPLIKLVFWSFFSSSLCLRQCFCVFVMSLNNVFATSSHLRRRLTFFHWQMAVRLSRRPCVATRLPCKGQTFPDKLSYSYFTFFFPPSPFHPRHSGNLSFITKTRRGILYLFYVYFCKLSSQVWQRKEQRSGCGRPLGQTSLRPHNEGAIHIRT